MYCCCRIAWNEGIYRKSGGAAQMRSIQLSFEQGLDPDLTDDDEYNDICAVTSILKQYFRELPDPLVTYELYPEFIEAIGKHFVVLFLFFISSY
jgi:hypothetical protein